MQPLLDCQEKPKYAATASPSCLALLNCQHRSTLPLYCAFKRLYNSLQRSQKESDRTCASPLSVTRGIDDDVLLTVGQGFRFRGPANYSPPPRGVQLRRRARSVHPSIPAVISEPDRRNSSLEAPGQDGLPFEGPVPDSARVVPHSAARVTAGHVRTWRCCRNQKQTRFRCALMSRINAIRREGVGTLVR